MLVDLNNQTAPHQPDLFGATTRPPRIQIHHEAAWQDELVLDLFAGGSGASTGIEQALGRPADAAINHDPDACRMYQTNHPDTPVYCQKIQEVAPLNVTRGRPVAWIHASPDCTHFSRARGTTPVKKEIRGLAWELYRWLKDTNARGFSLENVDEFQSWGPVVEDADAGGLRPDPDRVGETFQEWLGMIRALGYQVTFETLNAADYGTPTTRKRLFMVGRRDAAAELPAGQVAKADWTPAHSIINWDHPTRSIFTRPKPLALGTLQRIALGVERFCRQDPRPFLVRHGHYSNKTGVGLVPGTGAGVFRGQELDAPVGTICSTNDKNLVIPWIVKHYGGVNGNQVIGTRADRCLGTVTAKDSNALGLAVLAPDGAADRSEEVSAFLLKYHGTGGPRSLRQPVGTLTARDRYALVTVQGEPYRIVDIGTRMLQPDELFQAMGFPADWKHTHDHEGRAFTKTAQTKLCGNAVCPPVMRAIMRHQLATAA